MKFKVAAESRRLPPLLRETTLKCQERNTKAKNKRFQLLHDKKQKQKKPKNVWPDEPEKVQQKMCQREPQERWKPTSLQNSEWFWAAGPLSLSNVNMWGQIILCCETLSWMHLGTSSCIHVPIATIKNISRQCQMLPEGQIFLVENYCSILLTSNIY